MKAHPSGVKTCSEGDGWCMKPECRKCHPKASPASGVAPARAPSTEGHSPILQLAGDRCPCERCEADRQAASGVKTVDGGRR